MVLEIRYQTTEHLLH